MSAPGSGRVELIHGRIGLVLHQIARGEGTPLLLLHAWRRSARDWRGHFNAWPGSVHAIDFAGHGESDRLRGGAYGMELFVGDADAALAHLGTAAVAGAGAGAYVALLLAGARPDRVPAALLMPGAGLEGGGDVPDFEHPSRPLRPAPNAVGPPDPWLAESPRDVRPVDYAASFGRAATRLLLLEDGDGRPGWWRALAPLPGVETVAGADAPARLAAYVKAAR